MLISPWQASVSSARHSIIVGRMPTTKESQHDIANDGGVHGDDGDERLRAQVLQGPIYRLESAPGSLLLRRPDGSPTAGLEAKNHEKRQNRQKRPWDSW